MFFNKIKDKDYTYEVRRNNFTKTWQGYGLVEGKDFLHEALVVEFEKIQDVLIVERAIKNLFSRLNKNRIRKYKYIIDARQYHNGLGEIRIELSPRLAKLIKKLAS